jgi:hypothetical protein
VRSPLRTLSAFWWQACCVVVVNFVVIGVVVLRGDPPGLAPVEVAPANGARTVSTRPIIRLSFPRAIDPASLRPVLRLDPPIPGDLTVSGPNASFVPAEVLQPNTTYTLTVGSGVRDTTGRSYDAESRLQFQTRMPRLVVVRREALVRNAWGIDPQSGQEWRITNEKNGVQSVVTSSPT